MITRSAASRTFSLLLTLLQLLLPVAAVADAEAERQSRVAEGIAGGAHVESDASYACARVHPSDCALSHAAGALYTAALPDSTALAARVIEASTATELHSVVSRISQNPRRPRAPPTMTA